MASIHANGIDMYYEIHGEGELVVFIAGLAGDHANWLATVDALKTRYRCLIFDNRGMGQTDHPDGEYTTRLYAKDTAKLMEATGFGQAHIVGLSMGACIAQELCLGYPNKVRSMMLISGWARPDHYFSELIRLWIWVAENTPSPVPWHYGNLWSFSHRLYNETPEKLQAIIDGVIEAQIEIPAFVRQAHSLLTHDALDRLHLVMAPTMILVGSEDILTPPQLSRELHQAIPGSQLKLLDGQPHAFPLEDPQLLTSEILNFLSAVDGVPGARR